MKDILKFCPRIWKTPDSFKWILCMVEKSGRRGVKGGSLASAKMCLQPNQSGNQTAFHHQSGEQLHDIKLSKAFRHAMDGNPGLTENIWVRKNNGKQCVSHLQSLLGYHNQMCALPM
eukprot:1154684-Pelagomonas_calceolata.AAC.1